MIRKNANDSPEVDFPIAVVSKHSARERSIGPGGETLKTNRRKLFIERAE
jgi:hypothetical protein